MVPMAQQPTGRALRKPRGKAVGNANSKAIRESGSKARNAAARDGDRMRALALWTARTLETANPVPFGAEIVHTRTGERLIRALNAVAPQNDPSSHAEVRAVRIACRKLKTFSLRGYTLYSTCEP